MIPNVYAWLNVAAVNAYANGRLYPFGDAGESPTYPYVVWQTASSSSENYLSETPDIDAARMQVDIYARDQQTALDLGAAVRTELDKHGYQDVQLGPRKEPETQSYRITLDYTFWHDR